MIKISELIKKVSLHKLAVTMGLPISTVYSWKYTNSVPAWRVIAVVEACRKLGVDISDCVEGK